MEGERLGRPYRMETTPGAGRTGDLEIATRRGQGSGPWGGHAETKDGAEEDFLPINEELSIPLEELQFRFSRSSGPGGQHVQKSSTRAELYFDVLGSPSLSEAQRARILSRLAGYIDGNGLLRLVAQSERSQLRNRDEVVARFQALLRGALHRRKPRRPTAPTAASRETRLRQKRSRSLIKRWRGRVERDE